MRTHVMIPVALAAMGLTGSAWAQAPSGALQLTGTSTLGDWTCREPTIQPAPASAGARSAGAGAGGGTGAVAAASPGMTLSFPVHDIDCGDARMNDQLQHALQADRHPTIRFVLTPSQLERVMQAGPTPVAVDGTLTIAGTSAPVQTQVTVTPAPGPALRVKGEQLLRMSTFGVKPPRLFFGALRVQDLVRVGFDFILQRPGVLPLGRPFPR